MPSDPNDENNTASLSTSLPPAPQADLSVSKSGPANAPPNSDVTYTLTLTNAGPDGATNVVLSDTLPGTMTFVSLLQSGTTLNCTTPAVGAGGTITCTAATYSAGGTTTLTLTGHVPAGTAFGTEFTNTVVVTSDHDPNGENNASPITTTVSSADLSVIKTGPGSSSSTISYTINVANSGPSAALGVVLTDSVPTGTTPASFTQNTGPTASCGSINPGPVVCQWETLANGASAQFTFRVTITGDVPSVSNTASISASDSADPDTSNNSSTVTTTVNPSANLVVAKADSP